MSLFSSSQVNMQGYFYEVKISAYFKDLNGILTSQAQWKEGGVGTSASTQS
jgi:hypothetical protein